MNRLSRCFALFPLAALIPAAALPAAAQQAAPKWRPVPEMIIVTAAMPAKSWQHLLTGTHFNKAMAISASLSVPYKDLNLTQQTDADELQRRIHVAANMVCEQLDQKYPPSQYLQLAGDDCYSGALSDGLKRADLAIAAARQM